MFRPAKCLLLLGLVISATAIAAFAMQPQPPFEFMEERGWREAGPDEVRERKGYTNYVIFGKWFDIQEAARDEARETGLRGDGWLLHNIELRYYKGMPVFGQADVRVYPLFRDVDDLLEDRQCKVAVCVSERLKGRGYWDRLLAVFGAE
jgi:hypothetical protein